MVTIDDNALVFRLLELVKGRAPDEVLVGLSPTQFRAWFRDALVTLKLNKFQLTPSSVRRGGATHHFRLHQDLENTVFRGRWGSLKVARIYVTDGLAAWAKLQLSPALRFFLLQYANKA